VVNRQLGIRRSNIKESRRVALEFIERNLQTLVFANNRLATEVLVTYLKDACDRGPVPTETVRGYRGGYLPRERRAIERSLRAGEIRAVVATNALELGIDIGSLDVYDGRMDVGASHARRIVAGMTAMIRISVDATE
jgi:DEAD/DEAH box helicase domain-containing protein